MEEAEIIVEMRKALNLLKEKWQQAAGTWATLEFLEASMPSASDDHWMRIIARAEQLSEPYMSGPQDDGGAR